MAYYKEVEFEFPFSDEKNVSIIYAPNDVGKSCFFKGIIFALYGRKRGQSLKDLININALSEKDYESYVSIFGNHNGKDIEITRTIEIRGNLSGNPSSHDFSDKLSIWENQNLLDTGDSDALNDYINSIVHKEAAKYFFFDGEKIEAYNIASGVDYKEAITRILGLKEIQNGEDDFEKLKKEYEKLRDEQLEEKKEANKILQEKKEIEDELSALQTDYDSHNNELKEIKTRIVKLEDELKTHDEVKEKVELKQKLKQDEKKLEQEIKDLEYKKKRLFKNGATHILGCEIAANIRRDIKDFNDQEDDFTLTNNIKVFLENLKKKDKCVCGNDLKEPNQKIIDEFIADNFVDDKEVKRRKEKRSAFRKIDEFVNYGAIAKKEYLDACRKKVEKRQELNNVQRQLLDLKMEIGSFNEEAAEKITEEMSRLEQKIEDAKTKMTALKTKISLKQDDLDKKKNELNQFTSTDDKVSIANKKLMMADKISSVFHEYLERLTEAKKKQVQNKSTDVFLKLTNKPRKYKGLIITDNYDLHIELKDGSQYVIERGRSLNPSTGQSKIISLSYIAGINQSSNSAAPIVVDNPLGLFSKEHRERVMQYMPNFGQQVIFMVTTADLSEEYKKIIEPNVNCEYYLMDKSDTTWNKTQIADRRVY